MLPKLDAKFFGTIFKAKDNTQLADDEWVVFLAKDDVFWVMVQEYPDRCADAGCDAEQIQMAREMVERIARWRGANADKCHPPHAHGEETLNDT